MPNQPETTGYTSHLSFAPGEEVGIYLSSHHATRADVQLVRLDADAPVGAAATIDVTPQVVDRGSSFDVTMPASWARTEHGLVLWAFVMPTRPTEPDQVVIGGWGDDVGGIALAVSRGCAELWVKGDQTEHRVRVTQGLRPWAWYLLVGAVHDGVVTLHQRPVVNPYNQRLAPYLDWDETGGAMQEGVRPGTITPGAFHIGGSSAADGSGWAHHFDGKVDVAGVAHGALNGEDIDDLFVSGRLERHDVIARWDPAVGIAERGVGDTLFDTGPHALHARSHNKPTRLVTGRAWAGRDDTFCLDPAQYAAVSYASDSLTDCEWERSGTLDIPSTTDSGVYAARVTVGGTIATELPFVVRPTAPQAPLLVVLPTMTYIAESDDRLSQVKLAVDTPLTGPGLAGPLDDFGGSTGDTHPDGSGVCFASRKRPMRELRPDARSSSMPGPATFPLDLQLLRFLRSVGLDFDVITDEDLHAEGAAALAPYRAVVSGSRPVYATAAMLAALDTYLAAGGRMAYLGGGGYYWVTSVDPETDGVLEVRRGESGMRAWQAGPGELCHATTGERGGLWRGRGRPPQRLLGTGHAARGFGPGAAFRRMPDSYHRAVSWIFEGVDDPVFGHGSLLPGGAAALEIDRYDRALGSPPHARILATSVGLSDDYHQAIEETLFTLAGLGGRENEHVRADTVFFTTPRGGAVFSAGSAGWCAALAWRDFDNPVARVTENVVRGLLRSSVPGQRFDDEDDIVGPRFSRRLVQGRGSRHRQPDEEVRTHA